MPSRIAVHVTQEDIDKALRSNSARCVVAQAIARTVPTAHRISVDLQTVRFTDDKGNRRVYLTPVDVEQYVVAFDAGDTIHPFSFGLYETQRVNAAVQRHTGPGAKRHTARQSRTNAVKRVEALAADPEATEAQRAVAAERLAAAEARVQQAEAEFDASGQQVRTTVKPDPSEAAIARSRRPRNGSGLTGNNRNQRSYGQRALRINRAKAGLDEPGDFRGPLDT